MTALTRRGYLLHHIGRQDGATSMQRLQMSSDPFEAVRVVDEPTAAQLAGVSPRTWDRMRARGETPPVTQLSPRRIGYRLTDLRAWLDSRRVAQPA
jgi:predicted DNA-binding transcriptional regulator AlpA